MDGKPKGNTPKVLALAATLALCVFVVGFWVAGGKSFSAASSGAASLRDDLYRICNDLVLEKDATIAQQTKLIDTLEAQMTALTEAHKRLGRLLHALRSTNHLSPTTENLP